MLRIKDIQDKLFHLVGWENAYRPELRFDESLEQTESGLIFQNAHPLLTIENIYSFAPETYVEKYAIWANDATYMKGDKVRKADSENVYISLVDNNTGNNPTNSSEWAQFNPMTDFITSLTNGGIAQAVQNFIQMKSLNEETKNILERRALFDGAGRINATVENNGNLVGFEIVPVRAMGVTTKIERVALQMTGGTGTVRLYLFHSSAIDPIKVFDLEYTKTNGGVQWFDLDGCFLPYISSDNNAGGSWYLCYNQADLPSGMRAINVSKDWSREPCGTCNIGSLETWRAITKYLQISPFRHKAFTTFAEYPEMWDIAENAYTNTQNYGLNCEITVGCDLTDFIIQQRGIFANVIQLQVAYNILRALAMNAEVRVNRNQLNASKMDILYELDGKTDGQTSGLGAKLKQAYEALNLNTKGLDRVCLSCNNHGVRYTTA